MVYLQLLRWSFSHSVALSSDDLGLPAMLVATSSMFLGDEMAGGHLLLLGRSMYLRHVDVFDMLLVVAMENFDVSSSRRALASSCNLRVFPLQPVVRWVLVEGLLQCNFPFSSRVLL